MNHTKRAPGVRALAWLFLLQTLTSTARAAAPYPPSSVFRGLTFHQSTLQQEGRGSDIRACTTHEIPGDWGLYEAPQPWGPWRTIAYGQDLPEWTYTPAEKKRPAYLHSFPAAWISNDGETLWCVFDRGDQLNLCRCSLERSVARTKEQVESQ